MLAQLFLPDGSPFICVGDQAYRASAHMVPKTRTLTLANMSEAQQAAALREDSANMLARNLIEAVFAKHVSLFPATNCKQRQRL
eukprot:COSAG02_NODE_67574_length_252_cov_1.339869_1_plen_83_part_11